MARTCGPPELIFHVEADPLELIFLKYKDQCLDPPHPPPISPSTVEKYGNVDEEFSACFDMS